MKERKARIDGLETREALLAAAEEEFFFTAVLTGPIYNVSLKKNLSK